MEPDELVMSPRLTAIPVSGIIMTYSTVLTVCIVCNLSVDVLLQCRKVQDVRL